MTTTRIDIFTSPTPLDDLIAIIRAGHEVILEEGNTPLARVTPIKKPKGKRIAGLNKGTFEIIGDFDAPLPDEFWLGER